MGLPAASSCNEKRYPLYLGCLQLLGCVHNQATLVRLEGRVGGQLLQGPGAHKGHACTFQVGATMMTDGPSQALQAQWKALARQGPARTSQHERGRGGQSWITKQAPPPDT